MGLVKIVGAFVENDKNEILLVQEAKHNLERVWKIPTGHLKSNENTYSGIIREVKEETGYDIQVIEQIDHYSHPGFSGDILERFDFYTKLMGGNPKPKEGEILEMKWVDFDFLFDFARELPENHVYHKQILNFLDYRTK